MKRAFGLLMPGVILVAATTSCLEDGFYCPTDVPGPVIVVTVRDGRTGEPAAKGAVGYVQAGDYVDSLRVCAVTNDGVPTILCAAFKAGVYDVVINKPRYKQWSRTNVRVWNGHCGPVPVDLEAALEPIDD